MIEILTRHVLHKYVFQEYHDDLTCSHIKQQSQQMLHARCLYMC